MQLNVYMWLLLYCLDNIFNIVAFPVYIFSDCCEFPSNIIDFFVSVSPAVLLELLASCHEPSDAPAYLDSNRSTFHISDRNTVSLRCELAGELSERLLWRNSSRRSSRGEAALPCESWGATLSCVIVKKPSRTDRSGKSFASCVSTCVVSDNLRWQSSSRTLNRWQVNLLSDCADAL